MQEPENLSKPHLQIIIGSIRPNRVSARLAHWAADYLRASGDWSVELIDLLDWSFPQFALSKAPANGTYEDRLQRAWARTMRRGDAYLIAAPEYNHGYSGVLKTALDYLYTEWLYKPASCLAFGNAEGARMVESLQQVFVELGMVPVAPAAHIRWPGSKLESDRFAANQDDEKALTKMSKQLLAWRQRLTTSARPFEERQPPAPARVLVMGLGAQTIDSVVVPLQRSGIQASGLVVPGSIDQLPDASEYDLISFGRGALGATAERYKTALRSRNPDVQFVDTIVPLAVRQIESALALRADETATMRHSDITQNEGRLQVRVELVAPGQIGLTGYTIGKRVHTCRLGSLRLSSGITRLDIPAPPEMLAGIIIDADGAEFRHHAFITP